MLYTPLFPVVACLLKPVSGETTSTLAFGTTAPLTSVIVPLRLATLTWALRLVGQREINRQTAKEYPHHAVNRRSIAPSLLAFFPQPPLVRRLRSLQKITRPTREPPRRPPIVP